MFSAIAVFVEWPTTELYIQYSARRNPHIERNDTLISLDVPAKAFKVFHINIPAVFISASSFIKTLYIFIPLTFFQSCLAFCRGLQLFFFAFLVLNYVIFTHICIPVLVWSELQGETKILKLKNLRPQDYANYSCIASVRNVCGIPDRSVIFRLTNKTGTDSFLLEIARCVFSAHCLNCQTVHLLPIFPSAL